jgi:uncharacterized protein YdcH (DUF465 family)
MEKVSRKVDMHSQIERLEHKHSTLKHQVAELDRQRFLTADENLHVHALKKAKLATKDELRGLRKQNGG